MRYSNKKDETMSSTQLQYQSIPGKSLIFKNGRYEKQNLEENDDSILFDKDDKEVNYHET
jgi:hypothetical protein